MICKYIINLCIGFVIFVAFIHYIFHNSVSFLILFFTSIISVFVTVVSLTIYDWNVKEVWIKEHNPIIFEKYIKSYWNYKQTPIRTILKLPEIQTDAEAVRRITNLISLRKNATVLVLLAFSSIPCGVLVMLFQSL